MNSNIALIGMPGAGKSTVGVILAKVMGYEFIDIDLVIQKKEKQLLIDIITRQGLKKFIEIENKVTQEIITDRTIIATGGSVIYGKEAMHHLKNIATIIYIRLSDKTLVNRLGDIRKRGVVLRENQTFEELYRERCPLYEKYADIIIDAQQLEIEQLMETILDKIKGTVS